MKPATFAIDAPLAKAIMDYLLRQPMSEVEHMVNGIRTLRAVTVAESKPELRAVPNSPEEKDVG